MKREKEKDFYRKPYKETLIAIVNKFGDVSSRLLGYLDACCTYHNELVVLPPAKEIARIIGCGISTIYNAFNKVQEKCNFFRIQLSGTHILAYRTDPDDPKNFFDFKNQEYIPTQKNYFSKFRKDSQNIETQQPEPSPDKTCDSPQTIQTNSDLPDRGQVDEKINEEKPEVKVNKSACVDKQNRRAYPRERNRSGVTPQYDVLPGHQNGSIRTKLPQGVTQKKYEIPEDLLKRLQEREIPLTEQVKVAIASHDISKAYGAVTHVENTWATIRDPKGVFLFQLPKQPVERLGQLYPDDNLEKQKRENEAIELEIKQGRPSISSVPAYSRWERLKENLFSPKKIRPKRDMTEGSQILLKDT